MVIKIKLPSVGLASFYAKKEEEKTKLYTYIHLLTEPYEVTCDISVLIVKESGINR